MRLSIRHRIILFTLGPITLIYLIVFGVSVVQMQQRARHDVEQYMGELAMHYAAQFDGQFRDVARIAASTATFLDTHPSITEEQIYAQLRANVSADELVYGAAMAFEPGAFDGRALFCPYVYHDGAELAQIDIAEEAYDYSDGQWEWWDAPRDRGEAIWTEPYFDEGAGNILMCTYAAPMYVNGAFRGVTTIDIPLEPLNERAGLKGVQDLDFVIVTGSGRYVYHPDPAFILEQSIADTAERLKRTDLAELGRRMTGGERGAIRLPGWETDEKQWVFYAPINSAGWSFAARLPEHEAMADVRARVWWTAGVLAVSLALITAVVWFVSGLLTRPLVKAEEERTRIEEAKLDAQIRGMANRLKVLGCSVLTMTGTACVVAIATIIFLYMAARDQQAASLWHTVQAQVRLIDAVARFDRLYSQDAHPAGAAAATVTQVVDSHEGGRGLGETGEIMLGQEVDDKIIFLLQRRHAYPSTAERIDMASGSLAEPMRLALAGKSGTIVGPDYRGARVLAAYAPVRELDLGLVAKMDLSEIRGPFVKAAMIAGLVGLLLVCGGAMLMVRINNPLIRQVEDSETHMRTILSTCSEGFWFVDTEFRTLDVNVSLCGILDCGREDVLGKTIFDFVDEEGKAVLREQVKLRERGEVSTYELELIRADGAKVPCLFNGTPYYDQTGRRTGSFAMVTDITERKRAEESLAEAEERSRLLLESTQEGIFGVGIDGRVTFVNAAAAKLLGYEREEILGRRIHKLIHHSRADGSPYPIEDCPMHRAYTDGAVNRVDDEVLWRKDGRSFDVEYTSVPIHKGEEIVGAVVVFHDITERKLAEAQLRKLSSAVEQSSSMVVITDVAGDIEYVNSKFTEVTGYSLAEVLGQNPRLLNSGRQTKEFYEELWATIGAGREWHGEFCNRKKSGDFYWEAASISPIRDSGGQTTHFVAVKEDITDRKRAEEALLRAREEAEAANRAKSEFLSNMSHELRTPLNGVLGYAQILRRDPAASPKQRESLDSIESCGQHLLTLINDVLDLSKIEAGRMEIELAPCDFHRMLKGVFDIVRPRAEAKGLQISMKVSPEVPVGIVTDAVKLKQTLVNLLGNAVKFTESGSVSLHVAESEKDWLQMQVRDTGIGMTEKEIEEVFDPFKQAEGGKASGGTGLGLAISKRMVEALGGRLIVTSTPGEGSCFTIMHPLEEANEDEVTVLLEEADTSGELPVLAAGQDVTILIADDRDTNRDILVQLLEGSGFKTVQAVHGAEALEKMREQAFPLVLMDVRMPVMNGIEATQAIRADPALRDTIVIAVTASVFPEFRNMAKEAGFDDFLSKPLRAGELFDRMKKHLDLQFVEAAHETEAATGDAATISAEAAGAIAERLRDAVSVRNLTAINALAAELRQESDGTAAYGERIAELAGAFDFAGLERMIEQLKEDAPT